MMPVFKYRLKHVDGNFTKTVIAQDVQEASTKLAEQLKVDESALAKVIAWIEEDGKRIFQG